MIVQVRVIPRAKENKIVQEVDGTYKVRLTAAPVGGKANEALIKLLSKYFGVPKSAIRIVKGITSRMKEIVIYDI